MDNMVRLLRSIDGIPVGTIGTVADGWLDYSAVTVEFMNHDNTVKVVQTADLELASRKQVAR